MFSLHPTLAADSIELGELKLCQCRLINNMLYPWLLLIPKVEGASEILDLDTDQQQVLMSESVWLSQQIRQVFHPDRINVAALGNQVPQLHLHHIARFKGDAAWPNPVWGAQSQPYNKEALKKIINALKQGFAESSSSFIWSKALDQ